MALTLSNHESQAYQTSGFHNLLQQYLFAVLVLLIGLSAGISQQGDLPQLNLLFRRVPEFGSALEASI